MKLKKCRYCGGFFQTAYQSNVCNDCVREFRKIAGIRSVFRE